MLQPQPRNRVPRGRMIVAAVLIIAVGVMTLVGALTAFQLPESVTEQGDDITSIYTVTLVIAFLIYFLVTAGLIYAIFRFRRRDNELPQQIHGSNVLEFTWTIIPVIILVGLFIPAFILVQDLKTPPSEDEADVVIEVVGHQWWWEFIYADGTVHIQQTPPNYDDLVPPALVIPVGKSVLLKIRSTDVIHSFYVPHTLYKIQAIPGNINYLHMTPNEVGVYHGQCYQFCGLRHSDMQLVLDVRSEADYQRWLSEQPRVTPRVEIDTYDTNTANAAPGKVD